MKKAFSILVLITLLFSSTVGFAATAPKPLKNAVIFEAPINQFEDTFYDELTLNKEYTFFRTTEVKEAGTALIRTKLSFTEAARLEGGNITVNIKISDEYVGIYTIDELKKRMSEGLYTPKSSSYGTRTEVKFEAHPDLYIDKKPNLDVFIEKKTHTYEYVDDLKSSGRFIYFGEPLKIVFNTTKVPLATIDHIITKCPKIYENSKFYIEETNKIMENSKIPFDKSKMVFSQLDHENVSMVAVDANVKFVANSNFEYLKETKRITDEMTAKYEGVKYLSEDSGYNTDKKAYDAVMSFYVESGRYASDDAKASIEFVPADATTRASKLEKYNQYINAKPIKVALVRCPRFDFLSYEDSVDQVYALKIVNSDKTVNVIELGKVGNNADISANYIRPFLSSEELKKNLKREETIYLNDFLYSRHVSQALYFDKDYQKVSEAANTADERLSTGFGYMSAKKYTFGKSYANTTVEDVKNKGRSEVIKTNVITGKEMILNLNKAVSFQNAAGCMIITNVSYKEGAKTINKPITIIITDNKMFFFIDGKRTELLNKEIQ